jgi:type IV pilus assembly protein PilV
MPSLIQFSAVIRRPYKTPSNNSGFTLIEVLVTIVVVSIGLLGLAGLQISGLRANVSSEARSKATLLANDIIERMRANPLGVHNGAVPADDNQYANITTAGINCAANPAPFCSNSSLGPAATCTTAAQMAAFDAWVWACGLPPAGGAMRGGITNRLNNGTGSVTCNDNNALDADACSPGSPHTVTISWSELSPNATGGAAAGAATNPIITLVVVP